MLFLVACQESDESAPVEASGNPRFTRQATDPLSPDSRLATAQEPGDRQVFFGDLHVHSSWSFDAYAEGVSARPIEAYRYARGQSIPHLSGQDIQLAGPPLDFIALTDHAEYLGLTRAVAIKEHPIQRLPLIRNWRSRNGKRHNSAWSRIWEMYLRREGLPPFVSNAVIVPAWRTLIALANEQNEPGTFTTFVAFEYTPNPNGQNLHRNVLFRGDDAPDRPFSSMDSENPEDLWDWMDQARNKGFPVLSIPHNSNGSNGLMFASTRFDGSPIDREWIAQRARNEPVAEAFQIKGQSETHPALSPQDEWADFEIADWRTNASNLSSQPPGSYLRDALKQGLMLGEQFSENPYQLGMIGSTDGHMSSSPFEERNYTGKIGLDDATAAGRLAYIASSETGGEPTVSIRTYWGAAGLAGIWAETNTREALFDAIRRRETFATSGPRIRLQFHATWELESSADTETAPRTSQIQPVPMGGVLDVRSSRARKSRSPVFSIRALQDPLDAPLERAQIIKGWIENGKTQERVYDVACASGKMPDPKTHRCPDVSPEPSLEDCTIDSGAGASELERRWQDPDYTASGPAFYYARVLQVPSCRWSTYDAQRLGRKPHPAVPATIQERAVTSPIWLPSQTRTAKPLR